MSFQTHQLVAPALLLPLLFAIAARAAPPAVEEQVPADVKAAAEVKVAAQLAATAAQLEQRLLLYTNRYLKSFRPILTNELSFIRQVCEVPVEQRPKIKAAGEAKLLDQAKRYALYQLRRSGGDAGAAPPVNTPPNYRENIVTGLANALKGSLPPEQLLRYMEESERRAANRKRATILSVVSQLDSTLYLCDKQREEIMESLSANWRPRWQDWLLVRRYGDQVHPAIPDNFLISYLNEAQVAVWRRVHKIDLININIGDEVEADENDGWWGNEAPAPEVAPAKVEGERGAT